MRPRRLSHHLAAAVEEEAAAAAAAWRRIAEEVRRNQSCRIPLRVPEATPAPCRRSPLEFRCQQRCRLRQPRPQLAAAWPNWRRRQRRAAAAQTARRRDCTPTRASLLGQSACRGWSLRTALEREGRGGGPSQRGRQVLSVSCHTARLALSKSRRDAGHTLGGAGQAQTKACPHLQRERQTPLSRTLA